MSNYSDLGPKKVQKQLIHNKVLQKILVATRLFSRLGWTRKLESTLLRRVASRRPSHGQYAASSRIFSRLGWTRNLESTLLRSVASRRPSHGQCAASSRIFSRLDWTRNFESAAPPATDQWSRVRHLYGAETGTVGVENSSLRKELD